ncbi:MAG: hypothetical protein CVU30_00600 [Betaproteobacteria bacterium HGW-Betaproteobacteria-3]|jgi:uncharacterized protein involved in exopolysaccharide biosynthesis|nr:MAG: hypothetical protein CVU30_00600 [Betaproteobacteria bacterium HGW-Betaproteobacteria-3]
MSDATDTVDDAAGETTLLDLLVVLAENLKLLIVGPLLAGACALGLSFVLPKTYDSVAILQADASIASLMTSAAVLDPVIESLGLGKDETPGAARDRLREQVKASVGRTDKLLTLTVSAATAEQARAIATAVLEQTYAQSKPKGVERARLEDQLATVRERAKIADAAIAALGKQLVASAPSSATSLVEAARGYAELLNTSVATFTQTFSLTEKVEGLSPSRVVQPPTLTNQPSRPKKTLVAVGTTLATGVLLLLFVFARQAFSSANDAESARKLARIRQALGMKPAD